MVNPKPCLDCGNPPIIIRNRPEQKWVVKCARPGCEDNNIEDWSQNTALQTWNDEQKRRARPVEIRRLEDLFRGASSGR